MTIQRSVLVTGGAGYIGSHTAAQLVGAGYDVRVVDNLYSGHRWAVPRRAVLIEADASDFDALDRATAGAQLDAVVHFAGHIVVPESVRDPLKYYRNNTETSRRLIEWCRRRRIRRFIFSSSAAVYGHPPVSPVAEGEPAEPISPYGASKLMTEWMLHDVADAAGRAGDDFRYVALRYFNVAGARLDGSLGQATPEATHLIKLACQAAAGSRSELQVFGTDYDTADGTCVRDYIHVEDLAAAHLDALDFLAGGGESMVLNCGYGRGYSVREVIDAVKRVSGVDFAVVDAPRRPGDPPRLVADNRRILATLPWRPRHDDIDLICRTAYNWERRPTDPGTGGEP